MKTVFRINFIAMWIAAVVFWGHSVWNEMFVEACISVAFMWIAIIGGKLNEKDPL